MATPVSVVGAGYSDPETFTDFRGARKSKDELALSTIENTAESAGIDISEIDATVFTTVDGFEATNRIERTLTTLGQGENTPLISINTGGTGGGSAFKAAYEQVASGQHDLVLVYASGSFDSVIEGQQIMNTAAPPLFEKPIISAIHMGALYASKYMDTYDVTEEDLALTAAKNYESAANNPWAHRNTPFSVEEIMDSEMVAWPLRRLLTCPVSSGSGAMLLASEEKAHELSDDPVWVDDTQSITNTFLTGYRTYEGFPKLETLAERVYDNAGITDPEMDFDYVETFNPYIAFELMQYEALGFCEAGGGPEFLRSGITQPDGNVPWNVSGSVLCTNSGICASLSRHIEVALQLMGEAGNRQIDDPQVGLSHSWGSNLGQFHTLAIMSKGTDQ
ncbi:thiolase family protein [Natrinema gelatinilyticum]|uniref:thiolase family protein n=1 Tax=Natrinema gelatinilyticum TaxID=2961571 RepID=UPI0020C3FD60|nr:thiolase family protein [Natrinema gelatinilyticum]